MLCNVIFYKNEFLILLTSSYSSRMCLVLHTSRHGITPLIMKKDPVLPIRAGAKVSGTTAEIVAAIRQNAAFETMISGMKMIIAREGDAKHHHEKTIGWTDTDMLFRAAFALSNPRDKYCMKLQTTTVVFHVVARIVSERMIGGVYELTSRPAMDKYLMNPMLMEIEIMIVIKPRITNIDALVTSTITNIDAGIENTRVHFITLKK